MQEKNENLFLFVVTAAVLCRVVVLKFLKEAPYIVHSAVCVFYFGCLRSAEIF